MLPSLGGEKEYKFVTGSKYVGDISPKLKMMEGMGTYTYADGTEYTGTFVNGVFHGAGRITMAPPYDLIIEAVFEKGILVEILSAQFPDGLQIECSTGRKDRSINFKNWSYCTDLDRRFFIEHLQGLKMPAYKTADVVPRSLHKNAYDVGEGIYDETTRLISERRSPFDTMGNFVVCKKSNITHLTHNWIKKHCRYGGDPSIYIDPKIHHKIIQNNLRESESQYKRINCNMDSERKRKLFDQLCSYRGMKRASSADSNQFDDPVHVPFNETSATCLSSRPSEKSDVHIDLQIDLMEKLRNVELDEKLVSSGNIIDPEKAFTSSRRTRKSA